MNILKAESRDLEEILILQKVCYRETGERYNDFDIPPLTQTLEELKDEYKSMDIIKAVADDRIIGSIRYNRNDGSCYIGRIIVHPQYQNMGVGTKLINSVYEYNNDIKRFELFTGSRDDKNLYLYKKHGFREFKSIKAGKDYSLIYLEKTI